MTYIIITVILFALLLLYFRIADHYNIIDKPNARSSHTEVTIRGGGIVFSIAVMLYVAFFHQISYYMLTGIMLIAVISFLDDIYTLPSKVRMLIHILSVLLMFYALNVFIIWPFWLIAGAIIMVIGAINAYNFMDGINGITGLYSLAILVCLWYVNVNVKFADTDFIISAIIACLVFLFFNFRKKAKCFAGDVGSVTIGFWIISLIIMLIIKTGDAKYILFMTVYGIDAVLTIIHRIILRQNIFDAHRLHFYQILANERKIPHLVVAGIYAVLQILINCFIVFTNTNIFVTFICLVIPLAIIYVVLKPRWMQVSP